jgi:D-3-phosphoglycerate dehydrogenase
LRARVLIADSIADEGIRFLEEHADVTVSNGLNDISAWQALADAEAIVVRSATRIGADVLAAAPKLRVIGRAGIGVDNVDVDAASRRGIVVVNAPASVVTSAAEHTIALMLALLRHIPRAHASVAAGHWDRKLFVGTELRGKTIGIVGLGNIGAEVARRLAAFDVRLIAFDPYIGEEYAARLGIQLKPLDALVELADVITIHVPLTASTRNLFGCEQFNRMKPGCRLVNCARGGIIDESELVLALADGRVAGAALDVFVDEPPTNPGLLGSDRVVLTPHLGASTEEAQIAASVEVAQQVVAVLAGQPVRYAVNAPAILPESLAALGPYLALGEKLGFILAQMADGPIASIEITYSGEIAELDVAPVRSAIVKGILLPASPEHVNLMNALLLARNRGLQIVEARSTTPHGTYANLLSLRIRTTDGFARELAGTAIGTEGHLVGVDSYRVDVLLSDGYLLFVQNTDQPGVVGKIGTLLGNGDVNISSMQVGRIRPRGEAMMILAVDEPLSPALLQRLLAESPIRAARLVKI